MQHFDLLNILIIVKKFIKNDTDILQYTYCVLCMIIPVWNLVCSLPFYHCPFPGTLFPSLLFFSCPFLSLLFPYLLVFILWWTSITSIFFLRLICLSRHCPWTNGKCVSVCAYVYFNLGFTTQVIHDMYRPSTVGLCISEAICVVRPQKMKGCILMLLTALLDKQVTFAPTRQLWKYFWHNLFFERQVYFRWLHCYVWQMKWE